MNRVSRLHECGSATENPAHAALLEAALPISLSVQAGSPRTPSAPTDLDHTDPVDHAIARLLAKHAAKPATRPGRTADSGSAGLESAPRHCGTALFEAAGKALTDGRIAEALVLLGDAAAVAEDRPNALLGLAVCAVRLKCFDEGLVLALESRNPGPGHPRASHVAGLCELERGNRRAAQTHLATAARLARRTPEFREDLQLAQRTLLLMHLT